MRGSGIIGRPPVLVVDGRKNCVACGEIKLIDEFHRDRKQSSGFTTKCKTCRRPGNAASVKRWKENHPEQRKAVARRYYHKRGWLKAIAKRYGIAPEDYLAMLEAQGNRCAICSDEPAEGKRLGVDHCHDTDRIRGLLCNSCNTGIGLLREDPAIFAAALKYLSSTC